MEFALMLQYVCLSKSKNAVKLFSSNIMVFPRKTTHRFYVQITSSNWAENRPFSFDSHIATIQRRKVKTQSVYCGTIPCLRKHNFKNIGLILLFGGKQNQIQFYAETIIAHALKIPCCFSEVPS